MLAWSLRSAASLGLLAFVARHPGSTDEALAIALAALGAAVLTIRPTGSLRRPA